MTVSKIAHHCHESYSEESEVFPQGCVVYEPRDFMDRKAILSENNSTSCVLKIYRERNMPPIIERSLIPGSDYIGSVQDLKYQERNQYYVLKVWSVHIFLKKKPDLDVFKLHQVSFLLEDFFMTLEENIKY